MAAAGGGGILGIFSNLGAFDTTCQSACETGQAQTCAMDSDCPTGMTCQSPAGALGALGGGGGLAGVLGGGGAMTGDGGVQLKVCTTPAPTPDGGADAGGSSQSDSGTPLDGGTMDGGDAG
jgi:hypothetical protein